MCKAEIERKSQQTFLAKQALYSLYVSLPNVLDLTNAKVLKALNITTEDLICAEKQGGWELTWHIARLVYIAGFKGIIAPSATSHGKMLIIFDKYINETYIKNCSKSFL